MPGIDKNGRLVVGIILAAICVCAFLLFFFQREQNNRGRVACQDNLRKVGQAIGMYVADNDGYLPTEAVWGERAIPSLPESGCPAAEPIPHLDPPLRDAEHGLLGYAFNPMLTDGHLDKNNLPVITALAYASMPHPKTTIAVFDYTSGIPSTSVLDIYRGENGGWPKQLAQGWKRHGNGGNYLFCDGHVAWFPESAILLTDLDTCGGDKKKPNFCIK
ncbi:MAG: hypothetical protein H8F28_00425 [Fibrella sp.]|nr:hypothetical protein [Armatimonadota bacterium]